MSVPGGIRTKLALALVVIVGGALGAAYLMVVPSLERRLVDAKIDQLARDVVPAAVSLPFDRLIWPDYLDSVGAALDSRVVVFDVLARRPPTLSIVADTRTSRSTDMENDAVARRAVGSGRVERGRIEREGRSYGEVAVPLATGTVVLFSASLGDQLATVRLVERRLLAATVLALSIAAVLGTLAAAVLARRIRRLERAANRIAEGQFDEPVIDAGEDELGELAAAFDRMRVQLSQLDTARKEFVANASHELRTPLFALAGFLELIAGEDLDDATRGDFLRTMHEQVERLTKLSGDLLDLSRIDAGRLRVVVEDVDLGDVVRTVAAELRPLAEASGHVLAADEIGTLWASGDEVRVAQIARALVGNALVHTPAGTHVSLRVEPAAGGVSFAVEDDGPGIPGEHHGRIFDRFYRVEGGSASGSGLGLAIAHELAGRMGGTLRAVSRPGRTVFTLTLPAAAAPVEELAEA